MALQPVAELVRSAEEDRLAVEHAGEAKSRQRQHDDGEHGPLSSIAGSALGRSSAARRHHSVGGFEQFRDLGPVDRFGIIDPKSQPPSVAVMWRRLESNVLAERLQLGRISQEVQRATRSIPTGSPRRSQSIEDREAAPADPEQWTVLQFALIDALEAPADLTNTTEDNLVTLDCRVSHALSLYAGGNQLRMSPLAWSGATSAPSALLE